MSEAMIEMKNVEMSFAARGKRGERKQVLNGVNLTVAPGEIVGLAGESGSGKTTIAKLILGMHRPVGGSIECREKAPQMVFQDPYASLNPAYSISWIMQEPLRLNTKLKAAERLERVTQRLDEVGLDETYLARRPSELGGGQRQRICIGTALMLDTKLLIADEPVSALDVTVAAQVLSLLRRMQEERGLSMLFISHDLRTMYHFCHRILILREGRIIEEGEPAKLYREPKEEYTKLLLQSAGIKARE